MFKLLGEKTPIMLAFLLFFTGCAVDRGNGLEPGATAQAEPSHGQAGAKGPSSDAAMEGPVSDGEPPDYRPTTLLRGPSLQWVTRDGFHLMAEAKDEVPLVLALTVGGVFRDWLVSTPRKSHSPVAPEALPPLDGWLHDVAVTGMAPGEQFSIQVLNSGDVASGILPAAGQPLTFVIFGDNRGSVQNHEMVSDAIIMEHPALVINTGDMVSRGDDAAKWYQFFQTGRQLMKQAFYYPVFGNHELGGPASYFDSVFHTENHVGDSDFSWATVVGDLGLLSIDKYHVDWSSPRASKWLDSQLADLESRSRWILVLVHEPLYTFGRHLPWKKARKHLQPLLERHGVAMVVSGHNHSYEHFLVNGIHYVVTGGGGAPLYALSTGPADEQDLLVKSKKFLHYLVLNTSSEQLGVKVKDPQTGQVFEEFSIIR